MLTSSFRDILAELDLGGTSLPTDENRPEYPAMLSGTSAYIGLGEKESWFVYMYYVNQLLLRRSMDEMQATLYPTKSRK
jgi:hypothetical protein